MWRLGGGFLNRLQHVTRLNLFGMFQDAHLKIENLENRHARQTDEEAARRNEELKTGRQTERPMPWSSPEHHRSGDAPAMAGKRVSTAS